MPDLPPFAKEHRVRRIFEGYSLCLTDDTKLALISDAGALYRQQVRQSMCPEINTWAWFVSVKTGRKGLRRAGEAESSSRILRKQTRFEPIMTAQMLYFADFGGRRGARARPLAETFVQRARRLDKGGHTAVALDLIYDSVDELMQNTEFPRLDSILATVRASDHSVDVLLGILTATLPARSHLPSRVKLFKDIEKTLRERGEYEEGLLTGLEG